MTRYLAVCIASLALASAASAQPYPAQIILTYYDCPQGPYAVHRPATCTTNTGTAATLVASFVPPGVVPLYEAQTSVIELSTSSSTLSPWWHLEPGGCRDGSLLISGDFGAGPFSCMDFWHGQATASYTYEVGPTSELAPNCARIRTLIAVPEAQAGPIDNSGMWYAYVLTLTNANSLGTGSCFGCVQGATITLTQMNLIQPAPAPDIILTTSYQAAVDWGVGAGGFQNCPAQPTPNRRSTWGSVKALYR